MRALLPEDMAAARALLLRQFGGTRYEARMLELLEEVARGGEHAAAIASSGDRASALLISVSVAGAVGVERVACLVGDESAMTSALEWMLSRAAVAGCRLVMVELPDDAPFEVLARALNQCGFRQEARIDDFIADGVGLRFLTCRT